MTADESSRGIVEELGFAWAKIKNDADFSWLENQPPAIRALVHEYDAGPVRMAIEVGCKTAEAVEKLCLAILVRGIGKRVKPSDIRSLADRLGIARAVPVSRKTQARALQDEARHLDDMLAQASEMADPERGKVMAEILEKMRWLRDDLEKFPKLAGN